MRGRRLKRPYSSRTVRQTSLSISSTSGPDSSADVVEPAPQPLVLPFEPGVAAALVRELGRQLVERRAQPLALGSEDVTETGTRLAVPRGPVEAPGVC